MVAIKAKKRSRAEANLEYGKGAKRGVGAKEKKKEKGKKPKRSNIIEILEEERMKKAQKQEAKRRMIRGTRKKEKEKEKEKEPKEKEKEKEKVSFSSTLSGFYKEASQNPEGITQERLNTMKQELIAFNSGADVDTICDSVVWLKDHSLKMKEEFLKTSGFDVVITKLLGVNPEDSIILSSNLSELRTGLLNYLAKQEALDDLRGEQSSKIVSLEQAVSRLELDLKKKIEDLNDLKSQKESSSLKANQLESEMSELRKKFNATNKELQSASQSIDETKEEYDARLKAKNDENIVLKQQYDVCLKEKQQLALIRQQTDLELEEKRKEVSEYEQKIKQLSLANTQFAGEVKELARKLNKEQALKRTLEEKLNRTATKFGNDEEQLKQVIDSKGREIEALTQQIDALKAQQATFNMNANKIAEQESTILAIEEQRKSLMIQQKELAAQAAQAYRQGAAEGKREAQEAYQSQYRSFQEALNALTEEKRNVEQQKISLQSQNTQWEAKFNELQAQLSTALKAQQSANEVLAQKDGDIATYQKVIKDMQTNIDASQRQLGDKTTECVNTQKAYNDAVIALNGVKAESLALKTQRDKLTAENLKLQADNEELRKLQEQRFIAPPAEQGPSGDVVMTEDAISNIAHQVSTEVPLMPIPVMERLLVAVARDSPKKRDSTAPNPRPVSLAGKKRSLNATSGAYLVGGRPDPALNNGVTFWKNAYKKGFKLF